MVSPRNLRVTLTFRFFFFSTVPILEVTRETWMNQLGFWPLSVSTSESKYPKNHSVGLSAFFKLQV